MQLSQEQSDKLNELIKQGIPNYKIGAYLMSCGLSFRETIEARERAEAELKKRPDELVFAKIEEPCEPIVSMPDEDAKCVSCGREPDECSCPVKTINEIPF